MAIAERASTPDPPSCSTTAGSEDEFVAERKEPVPKWPSTPRAWGDSRWQSQGICIAYSASLSEEEEGE
jgi:hypothetical protein